VIGLDTNVLLRAVMLDDAGQFRRAKELISRDCSADDPGFVSAVVLLESAWVLEKTYGYSREDLARVVNDLLSVRELLVEHADAARAALSVFQNHQIDFADALICAINKAAGCSSTATFDRKAARLEGFSRVP
jgi:predicted nucleic-acid-binding protein